MGKEAERYMGGRAETERPPGLGRLPPDVEPQPVPVDAVLRRWLDSRHIAACDRGAACQGIRLGALLGELILAFKRGRDRRLARPPSQRGPRIIARSRPRIRRSPFYRRARALQFKRSFQR